MPITWLCHHQTMKLLIKKEMNTNVEPLLILFVILCKWKYDDIYTKVCMHNLHISIVSFSINWIWISITINHKIVCVNGNRWKYDHNNDAKYPSKFITIMTWQANLSPSSQTPSLDSHSISNLYLKKTYNFKKKKN